MSPGEIAAAIGQTVDPVGRLNLVILTIGLLLGVAGVSGLVAVLLTRISRLERQIEKLTQGIEALEKAVKKG